MSTNTKNPKIILLISGKRKCGKDFIAEKLRIKLLNDCTIIRISEPIKSHYAKKCGVSLAELMGDGPCKEKYRRDMIAWGERMRSEDPGCFCRIACSNATVTPIWIVSDIRRRTDVNYFMDKYGDKVKIMRVEASPEVRKTRGWVFTEGVDDAESECDLDNFQNWDLETTNNGDEDHFHKVLQLLGY